MKILIITHPYCGASDLAVGLSTDLDLAYFQDPLDNTVPLTVNHPMESIYMRPGDTVYPVRIPRGYNLHNNTWVDSSDGYKELQGYNYPDDVPDNTIITHNVKWHKLPGNLTEEQFIDIFMDKFDHILCLGTDNIENNWKSHCASLAQVKEDNYLWRKWALENNFLGQYVSSMLDEDLKLKHETAQSWLKNYASYQGFNYVKREEIFGWGINSDIDKSKVLIDKLNLPLPEFKWDNDNNRVTLPTLHSNLKWEDTQGNKY
tara:strand:+ start:804 stop:1583 length:780 start_codon:yes stop_codon:yes gene_type:complete